MPKAYPGIQKCVNARPAPLFFFERDNVLLRSAAQINATTPRSLKKEKT
jgi:hypothetical protein